MNSKKVESTLILTIEEAELYETRDHKGKLITKGPLLVFFVMDYNCLIMRINDFNYTLSREIPVLSKPADGFPQYVFPNVDGFYVVKVTQMASLEALSSFETILNEHCILAHEKGSTEILPTKKEEDIKDEDREKERVKAIEPVIEPKKEPEQTNTEIASNIIAKGGELTRICMMKGAEYVSSGISSLASYLKVNYISKEKELDLSESTINRVKIVHTASKHFENFTNTQVEAIVKKGKEIAISAADQASKTDYGKKFEISEYKDTIVEVGKSTIHAVGCIYEGMFEAIAIIGVGLSNDATDIVQHKYGERASIALRYGLEAIGNFAIKDVIRKQLTKVMKKTEPEPITSAP